MMCQDLADALGSIVPEGVYVALLSTDDVNASARITPSSVPYIRPDGALIAANSAALFGTLDGHNLINRIFMDETGLSQGPDMVWTGTSANGTTSVGRNCMDWTSNDTVDIGLSGSASSVSDFWITQSPLPTCDNTTLHIRCVKL